MKQFTRLYAEGGDILNSFYPTGAVGGDDKKKRCKGGKCTVKQPRRGGSAFAAPGMGGRKKVKFKRRY